MLSVGLALPWSSCRYGSMPRISKEIGSDKRHTQ